MNPRPTPLHLARPSALLTPHHRLHPALISSPYHRATSHISTTATGTNYERLALLALQPLAFDLRRVGGRADRGIDLIGRWRLPSPIVSPNKPTSSLAPSSSSSSSSSSSIDDDAARTDSGAAGPEGNRLDIPVIAQCKGHKTTPHPAWVRELEGAVAAAPGEWRDGVGVLVSMGKATAGVREAVMGARRGLVWVQMMEEGDGGGGGGGGDGGQEVRGRGSIGQVLWNKQVGALVGEGVGVGFVYRPMGGGKVGRELRLMYEGKMWEPEPGT